MSAGCEPAGPVWEPVPPGGGILRHMLHIDAGGFPPAASGAIPRGPEQPGTGAPFGINAPRAIDDGIGSSDPRAAAACGCDACFVPRPPAGHPVPRAAAVPHGPGTGRALGVRATRPGVRRSTADRPGGGLAGPGGRRYGGHDAGCPKTRYVPYSPDRGVRPSTVPRPGEVVRSRTEPRSPRLAAGGRP
jgi:hypothetical protein